MKKNLIIIRLIFAIILIASILTALPDMKSGFMLGWNSNQPNSWTTVSDISFKPNKEAPVVLVQRNSTDSISFATNYHTDVKFKDDKNSSALITFIMFLIAVTIIVLGIKVLINFYRFLNALVKEEVFSLQNVRRLFRMGIFIAAVSPLLYLFYYLNYMNDQRLMDPYAFKVIKNFDFQFEPLLFGLILVAISYVFKKGIEMQQEQALTI